MWSLSPCHPPAVHADDRAVHVVRRPRGQEDDAALEILRLAPTSRGDACQDRLGTGGIGADAACFERVLADLRNRGVIVEEVCE